MRSSCYRRERNHLSATDAWREAAAGDAPYMCMGMRSFECRVSKQMWSKQTNPTLGIQTKTRSAASCA